MEKESIKNDITVEFLMYWEDLIALYLMQDCTPKKYSLQKHWVYVYYESPLG
jgi:hypothetical protein